MGEYLGFGAGAHGYLDNVRYSNCCSIEEYVNSLNNTKKPVEYSEELSDQEKLEETIMLGLRTKHGINLDKIKKEYNVDLFEIITVGVISFIRIAGTVHPNKPHTVNFIQTIGTVPNPTNLVLGISGNTGIFIVGLASL